MAWFLAHLLGAGVGAHFRLAEISSNFARFDRNPNAAITVAEATVEDMTVAVQRVLHDADHVSHLRLPIVD